MNLNNLIEEARSLYGSIEKMDPEGKMYLGICSLLDSLSDQDLIKVRDARIKWVSTLANNRCIRRGLK
ncbi:MAG: hypothetical protein ACWGQW_03340 [bacterium]